MSRETVQRSGSGMIEDIVERIDDLIIQATTERSHYYVASTLLQAKDEIERLREIERGLCQ